MMPKPHRRFACLLTLFILLTVAAPATSRAPVDPGCVAGVLYLYRDDNVLCAETIVERLDSQGIASIAGLALTPDGSLYFARPATRQIIRLPINAIGVFPTSEVFAANLPEPPNGLAYDPDGKSWYVSADTMILRLRDQDGDGVADEQTILVRDLPGGVGGWLGNIHIGPDRRLYVAKASSCDACIETDPRRAALLSFALDGSDPQIVATGLRDSYDFDWNPRDNTLYIVDDERRNQPAELNAVTRPGLDFGWPRCDAQTQPVPGVAGATTDYCAKTVAPVVTFAPDSHPTGIAFYRGDSLPELKGSLLVALSGSWNAPTTTGYELDMVPFDAQGKPGQPKRFLPDTPRSTSDAALLRMSFYPFHLAGVAVSSEGWIYTSVTEGRIYRFFKKHS